MRQGVSPVVAGLAVLAMLVAGGVVAFVVVPSSSSHSTRGSAGHPRSASTPVPAPRALRPDQAVVEGTVSSAHVVGAVGSPVPLPLTITIPNRGEGEMTIDGVLVDGQRGSVAWDGGQPLPLSGTGSLDLGPATMDIDASGVTWYLDGAQRFLDAGQYAAGSAVAVGTGGLATPMDQATFVVARGTQAVLESVGGARIHLSPRALRLSGSGTMALTGSLSMRTSSGTKAAHQVQFGPGPFLLSLDPAPGGMRVQAFLQGPHTAI